MKQISKSQISAIYALLTKCNLYEDKARIVSEISRGRTQRISGLTFSEAMSWINAMNKAMPQEGEAKDKMVRHIIAMAHEMGWIRQVQKVDAMGNLKWVNDYGDLHAWVLKYGYLHKPLNKYTYQELPTLVTAFKNVYLSHLRGKKQS